MSTLLKYQVRFCKKCGAMFYQEQSDRKAHCLSCFLGLQVPPTCTRCGRSTTIEGPCPGCVEEGREWGDGDIERAFIEALERRQ